MSSSTLTRVTPAPVILPCRKPQVGFSSYDHFKTQIYTKLQVGMLVLADSTFQILRSTVPWEELLLEPLESYTWRHDFFVIA